MDLKPYYNQEMKTCVNMALATSVGGQPNVRVVTFGFDEKQPDKLFFSTFKGNAKIREFEQNAQVACMPLPLGPEASAQIRIFGRVRKSAITLQELIGLIAQKAPEDGNTLEESGDMLELYEVCFTEAWVTVGMTDAQRYAISK